MPMIYCPKLCVRVCERDLTWDNNDRLLGSPPIIRSKILPITDASCRDELFVPSDQLIFQDHGDELAERKLGQEALTPPLRGAPSLPASITRIGCHIVAARRFGA